MNKLEVKLANLLEKATKEDHVQWLSHSLTQALLTQLELNASELMFGWATSQYSFEKQDQAQGQAAFILEFIDIIKGLKALGEESDD